jgi:hypothetical protein
MAYFQTKNPYLDKIWEGLTMEDVGPFLAIWSILRPFGLFYGNLVYFLDFIVIWYIFCMFWYVVPIEIWQPCKSGHFFLRR